MSKEHTTYQGFDLVGPMGEIVVSKERPQTSPMVIPFADIKPEDSELVGGKVENLANLIREGFPVPNGVCLTTAAYDSYLATGEVPPHLLPLIQAAKAALGGQIAIRSSATVEDREDKSMAGVFSSIYVTEDDEIEPAIRAIYKQAQSEEVNQYLASTGKNKEEVKVAIGIQELITPDQAGVMYTGVNGTDTYVQYVQGFGADLVDGVKHGSSVIMDHATGEIKESNGYEYLPLPQQQLQRLAELGQQITEVYGGHNQDVEFAIVDEDIFVLQARRLTTQLENIRLHETESDTLQFTREQLSQLVAEEKAELGTDKVVFSDSNFSELLPRPTEMDFGVFAYIFTGSEGVPGAIQLGRQEMGYQFDDAATGYMYYVGGRPYFSLAKDALTFYAGFPDSQGEYLATLGKEYLEAVDEDPEKGHYPEMGLYLQDPTLEQLKERFGEKAEEYYSIYSDFKDRMGEYADTFLTDFTSRELPQIEEAIEQFSTCDVSVLSPGELGQYCQNILEHMRTQSCVDFVKAARLGFYYSQRMMGLLEEAGISDEHQKEDLFVRLSQGLDGSMITDANRKIIQAETDDEALTLAKGLVGHYSTGEMLEIRHPRLKDDEAALSRYVDGLRQVDYEFQFDQQKAIRHQTTLDVIALFPAEEQESAKQVIEAAQKYMALRETVKYHFVREYSLLRDGIESLGRELGIPSEEMYHLYPHEIAQLIEDSSQFAHLIQARKIAFGNYAALDLPHIIRECDIDDLNLVGEENNTFKELTGKFLAEGRTFLGRVVNIDEFESAEELDAKLAELRSRHAQIILVGKQMNLGHDNYIASSDGIIIENAGLASHGAARARESGKGALGGIKTKLLQTDMLLYFDPENRMIKNYEEMSGQERLDMFMKFEGERIGAEHVYKIVQDVIGKQFSRAGFNLELGKDYRKGIGSPFVYAEHSATNMTLAGAAYMIDQILEGVAEHLPSLNEADKKTLQSILGVVAVVYKGDML